MGKVKKQTGVFLFLWLMLFGILAGCGQDDSTNGASSDAGREQVAKEAFPVTVKDDSGTEVTIEEKPERIVSLLPSTTETLFALGLEEEVVGVSDFDTYPEQVSEKEKAGGVDPNMEMILSLDPDVLFVQETHATNHTEMISQFEQAGIKVIVAGAEATSFEEAYADIELIGEVTGTDEEAESIIKDISNRLDVLKKKAATIESKKSVLVEISPQPEIYVAGENTFIDEMLTSIGADNAAAGSIDGWALISEEQAVKLDPDTVIVTYGDNIEDAIGQVLTRDGWQGVKAVKEKQVFKANPDLVTRPGPRLIDGVEALAQAVYPDVYK
ncbi:MAG: ABC transporter substrate-binding protein [Bacillus sp. (in: firmicutes)]